MKSTLIGLVALIALLMLPVVSSTAMVLNCGPADKVEGALAGEFREYRVGRGTTELGVYIEPITVVVELWRRHDFEAYTVTVRFPDGRLCPLIVGEDWSDVPLPKLGSPH